MINKTPSFIILVSLTTLLLFSCKQDKDQIKTPQKKPTASAVDVYIVSPSVLSSSIQVPGNIAPFEATELHPEVAGRITSILFSEGTQVNKGTLLVKLYDADLQAQLKKIQVQLAIAQKTEERQKQLLQINGISQQDYDLSQLNVFNLQADIEILKTSIAKTEIRAPFSGKIGFRNVSLGAYVTPATIIASIREVQQLKLEFALQEKYTSKIHIGDIVQFNIDGNAKNYTAKIIATESNIEQSSRSLLVKAIVINTDQSIVSGAFANVVFNLGKNETALMIPSQAIIPQVKNKKVLVVRDGLASLEVVTTGIRDTTKVEITSGIKSGDTILVSGLLNTKPGSPVSIKKITQ
jgi:membrane fusion protein, multidrug efflux system